MQRRLIPTTITLLVLIEVFTLVRTFTGSQLVPPVFTQRVEIQSTRIVQPLRSPIGLIAFFRVGDNYRTPVPQRILVQVNILVRYAFAESFLDGIANCRTGRRADHTEQRRAHHSECDQWSNSRHREARARQSRGCTPRRSDSATHGRTHRAA